MLKLLGRLTSGNVQKVVFALEELKLPYQREDYGRQFNNTQTPDYGALNPTRKVPTLLDGDLAIWESHAILRYLAAKSGSDLYPTGLAARTHVDRWMDWQLASLNAPYVAAFLETRKPEAERNPDILKPLRPRHRRRIHRRRLRLPHRAAASGKPGRGRPRFVRSVRPRPHPAEFSLDRAGPPHAARRRGAVPRHRPARPVAALHRPRTRPGCGRHQRCGSRCLHPPHQHHRDRPPLPPLAV